MPHDNQDDKGKPAAVIGRTYRGEASPPITTPEAVARTQAAHAEYAKKPGAVDLHVYFVTKGINNPILQASMRAYPGVPGKAPVEDFDKIFAEHHEVPAPKKPAEEKPAGEKP